MKADVDQKSGTAMSGPTDRSSRAASASGGSIVRSRLFIKYLALFVTVVVLALVANGAFEVWFSYREHKSALIDLQHQQAQAAADKIEEFITQIESQLGWTTQLPWADSTLDQRRFDALRLLRQVPAITELAQIDASGHEQLKVSRLTMDVVGSGIDYSNKPEFTQAVAHKVYYGPVYFRRESEPYMTLSLAGTRRETGVSIAQVNLKLIWDVISSIKVGEHGHAYVVDGDGRLIAHPDISLVLRNTDMSKLAQVKAARAGGNGEDVQEADDIGGHKVLTAYAPVIRSAGMFSSKRRSRRLTRRFIGRSSAPASCCSARFCSPSWPACSWPGAWWGRSRCCARARRASARGDLSQRISIKTGDEVEGLADQFNDMAGRLAGILRQLGKKGRTAHRGTHRNPGAADGDVRSAEGHQLVARRVGAGVPGHAGECDAHLRCQVRRISASRGRCLPPRRPAQCPACLCRIYAARTNAAGSQGTHKPHGTDQTGCPCRRHYG